MTSNETDDGLTQQQHWETITVAIPGARDLPSAYRPKHRKTWRDKALTARLRGALHRGDHR